MSEISLYFSSLSTPELVRTEFCGFGQSAEKIVSTRGKYTFRGGATFQWTSAVRAISLLFVETSLARTKEQSLVLSGELGSAAASIDFSIEKQPTWLREMFGEDSKQNSNVKRVIRRGNPHGKKPGPFLLTVSDNVSIKLYIDNLKVEKPAEIIELIEGLKTQVKFKKESSIMSGEIVSTNNLKEYLINLFTRETNETLRTVNPLSDFDIKQQKKSLIENPNFIKVAGDANQAFSSYQPNLTGTEKLGQFKEIELLKQKLDGLKVVVPPSLPASFLLFYGLKKKLNFNINIDYHFLHAVDVVSSVVNHKFTELPDVLVLGNAPAATLLSSQFKDLYSPALLMPKISHRIVGHEASKKVSSKKYLMLEENPATPIFYFDALTKKGELMKGSSETEHIEGHEAFQHFSDKKVDELAVLFFPHYDVNRFFNDCQYFDSGTDPELYQDSPLFVHSSILADVDKIKALDIALRKVWLNCLEEPQIVEGLVREMIEEPGFYQFILRVTGLFALGTE